MATKPLTSDDFINPLKGNAAFNLRERMKEFQQSYFEKVSKDLLVSCVYNEKNDRYMFFFKYPSGNEKYPTSLYYDVILEFNPKKTIKDDFRALASIKDYEITMFSNAPSFVFTFTYVVNRQIGWPRCMPKNLLSRTAIIKAPKVRNVYQILTIEKTTWICFWHLYYNGYMAKNLINSVMSTKKEDYFINQIVSQPAKLKEIKVLEGLAKEDKLKSKAEANKKIMKSYNDPEVNKVLSVDFRTKFKMDPRKIFKKMNDKTEKQLNDKNRFKINMKANMKIK